MASITELKAQASKDEEAVAVPIYQRNGEPYLGPDGEPCTISVIGSESAKYKRDAARAVREIVNTGRTATTEEIRVEKALCAITDWSGWTLGDDETLAEPTPENLRTVLSLEHIRNQVEAGIDRRSAFFESAS